MKQSISGALCLIAVGLVAGCRETPVVAQPPAAEYRDVGGASDFDQHQNIYFDKDSGFGPNGQPVYWDLESPQNPGAFYEDDSAFWWVTSPPTGASGVTGARAIKLHHYGRFRVQAKQFTARSKLYLSLRIKDDLLAPAPVFSWDGQDWTQLGGVGGKRDHIWKTQQFGVPAGARAIDNGTYVFKIGLDQYKDAMKGELLIDQIKLATDTDHSEFPPDQAGYWPRLPPSNFSNIGATMEFIPGQGAFFPFGVYDNAWISDGGTATRAGQGKKDSWKILEDAKMNCYVVHGYEQNWGSGWQTYPDEAATKWAKPAVFTKLGLQEHLAQAAAHHLKVIPNFLTDTRSYWIRHTYQTEAKDLGVLGNVMGHYANDPNILMWYPVDEWDHEDDTYGKPHLYSHLLYNTQRQRAPQRPGFMLCMGFLGPDTWRLAAEEADVLGVDSYPGDSPNIETGLQQQAQRLNDIRSVLGRAKPYILVPELWQADRKPRTSQQVVAQAYLAFIHGARGILYFRYGHPADPSVPPRLWDGVKQVGQELFGANGLSQVLLPPSRAIDFLGESKIVTCSNPAIHASLFQNAQGQRTLLTLNLKNTPVKDVRFTITDLNGGVIATRFEAGPAPKARGNAFTDDFDALQRHVYDLGTQKKD